MAVASAAMIRPGGGVDPQYFKQRIYDTDISKSKRWPPRMKTGGSGGGSVAARGDRSPDSGFMYGTISAPGGSALSKSMKYAETWLYGTARKSPAPQRPSLFAAYPDVPGPVIISTPQKAAPNYAVILCSCPDYLNGTKKSSSTKVSICKKCKGSRLPLTISEGRRVLLGGTVRGPPMARDAGVMRAGTVRVPASKPRPSILQSQNGDSTDPYDLMRRSRLAPPHDARIGSQFSAARTRAKSISPSRKAGKSSPLSDLSRKNRSKSVSRVNELWIEENPDYPIESKRSILACDVNPYELMKYKQSSRSNVEIEFDNDYNMFDASFASRTSQQSLTSSYKAISGQKIRIVDETKVSTVEEVSVYDPVNVKANLKNYDLKTQELSASVSLPNSQTDKHKKKTQYNNGLKSSTATSTPLSRAKLKNNLPKRPPRKMRTDRMDDDSESDNQKDARKIIEIKPQLNLKNSRNTSRQNDTIKSILKKPRVTINETYHRSDDDSCNSSDDRHKGSQFYLPKPNALRESKRNTVTARKRVQFLVEHDNTKIIYTAEFDLTENKIFTEPKESYTSGCTVKEIVDEVCPIPENIDYSDTQISPRNYEDVATSNKTSNMTFERETENKMPAVHESNDLPKVVILRRSESERLHTNVAEAPKFLDSMALRAKPSKIHTSQVFLGSSMTLNEDKDCSNIQKDDTGSTICKIESTAPTSEPISSSELSNSPEIDWSIDPGNMSDNSDFTEEILRNLRRSISMSPDPPPRLKSKSREKQSKPRMNNYVKTRFVRANSTSSTSDEYSDNYECDQKTILRVEQFDAENDFQTNSTNTFNESNTTYEDFDAEPRRTSIQINGDDCYSTMNVSNDAPLYLSSVVVNDDYSTTTYQSSGSTVTISINSPEIIKNNPNSKLPIKSEEPKTKTELEFIPQNRNNNNEQIIRNVENHISKSERNIKSENSPFEAFKGNIIPHVCGKSEDTSEEISNELRLLESENCSKDTMKFGFVAKLLDDPLLGHLAEGLDSELVTKLIENSLMRLQESKANNRDSMDKKRETMTKLIESSLTEIKKSEVANESSEDGKNDNTPRNANNADNTISSETDENGCSAPYESMEYESGILGISSDLEPLSDCYNASASELSTEEDGNSRSKFYQMLVDAALCEIEVSNNADDEHVYESIRLNSDPIYEEIGDVPPPLPINPPPSSLLSSDEDRKSGSRSIFEGASKYDILSYLVDAKERGIDSEETYITNYSPEAESVTIAPAKEKEVMHDRSPSDICSNVSQLSNGSDSSEDNSLVIAPEVIEKTAVCKKTSAEIERNDSGVGSETSKCSRSRWQGRSSPINSLIDKESPIHLCEDCDTAVETQITESGAMYAPLVCRKCAKKRAERKEIIMEIVETEEKYGRDLQIILEEFYKPMLVAGLLTQEQLSAIFLNVEELIENNQTLSEKMRDALEIAIEQGDEDLLTVNIGKLMLECSPMLAAFQAYCVRQAGAALLLAGLEKEKELLRIFLRVSQMENAVLRRMNLNSFLMVPVQRVTKYPLLLSRLYRASASCAADREDVRAAQRSVEERLAEMNQAAAAAAAAARDVPLWRRLAAARRTARDLHVADIRLRKMAVDVLEWNHDEARFAMEGRLLFTQPNDNNWRKGRTIKLTPINALLVTNGKPTEIFKPGDSLFPRASGVREAALLLVREKAGRYTLHREPLYLDRCVVAADAEPDHFFEVHEITTKEAFIFKAEECSRTRTWYRQLQFHAQGVGAWRKRRNALANIMINPMLTRN